MITFWKDVFAITAGAFFGAMLARAMDHLWVGGLFLGGAIGYLARLLTEPQRIRHALRQAYESLYYWHPKKEWRACLREGSLYGIGAGGVLGMFVFGPFSAYRAYEQGALLRELIYPYYFAVGVSEMLALIFGAIFAYQEYSYQDKDAPKIALHLNAVALHYHILIGAAYLIFYSFVAIRKVPRFLKLFAIFVHSEKFTACGTYALLVGSTVFFCIPYNPPLMLIASGIGGFLGTLTQSKVLAMLKPALT